MSLEEVVQAADLIVSGRVVASQVHQDVSGRIDTEYTFEVEQTFWGQALPERILRLPGGVLPDGSGMVIPGIRRLGEGQEFLLALRSSRSQVEESRSIDLPIGLAQGVFAVLTDPQGQRWAQRAVNGFGVIQATGEVRVPGGFQMPYGELVSEVVRGVEERRARGEEPSR